MFFIMPHTQRKILISKRKQFYRLFSAADMPSFNCYSLFFDRIAAGGRMRIPEIGLQQKDVTLLSSYR